MAFFWVGVGGVAGALLRYGLSKWIGERVTHAFPWATLLINVTGAFLLGLLAHLWASSGVTSTVPMLLLGTGFCGAYTTFSTFSYEFVMLTRERRFGAAGMYVLLTTSLGFAATGLGLLGLSR